MKQIRISDATMKQSSEGFQLSFKEKIEIAKLLDRLGADIIELEGIKNPRIDSLQIKSIAAAVSESCIARKALKKPGRHLRVQSTKGFRYPPQQARYK